MFGVNPGLVYAESAGVAEVQELGWHDDQVPGQGGPGPHQV